MHQCDIHRLPNAQEHQKQPGSHSRGRSEQALFVGTTLAKTNQHYNFGKKKSKSAVKAVPLKIPGLYIQSMVSTFLKDIFDLLIIHEVSITYNLF